MTTTEQANSAARRADLRGRADRLGLLQPCALADLNLDEIGGAGCPLCNGTGQQMPTLDALVAALALALPRDPSARWASPSLLRDHPQRGAIQGLGNYMAHAEVEDPYEAALLLREEVA